jgi:DNA-binding response OmpR family regulator
MKILLIEDKLDLASSISEYLLQHQFYCDTADNILTAQEKINQFDYDCIILDITFPIGNGFEILKALKENHSKSGVIIISAKDSLDDKLKGLELGADDYLTKPFHLSELSARVNAIYRRRSFEGNNSIIFDKIHINILDMLVKINRQSINLTRKEYDLLLYFISNKNKVVTKESILDHLWDNQPNITDNYDLIYVHIKNLRKKLVEKGCPDYFSSVYGLGYRFSVPKADYVT